MPLSTLVKGDDWKFTGTVLTPNGTPLNITGGKAHVTFKSNPAQQSDSAAEFQVEMDPIPATDPNGTDAANGIVVLVATWDGAAINPPNNTLVNPGKYSYDFQYIHTDGSITTIEAGSVTVAQEITDTTG